MVRPAACVSCRQNKLRCNSSSTFPAPCSRCSGRNLACRVDLNYKRVPTRNRVEQLTKELDQLKSGIHGSTEASTWTNRHNRNGSVPQVSGHAEAMDTSSPRFDSRNGLSTSPQYNSNIHDTESLFKLEDLVLSQADVDELFREYYSHYHDQLPVIDEQLDPVFIFHRNSLLFWTIIFVSCRNLASQQHHFAHLSEKMPRLLGNLMTIRQDSVYPIQALLILCMWPVPVRRQSDDMRWVYSGMAMQMAMQAGWHSVGYEHEYHGCAYSKSATDEQAHTRTWRCCCFMNALLSCELGLPCLVPFDALELRQSEETALQPDFVSKLRIALYVCRINDTLGHHTSEDYRSRIRVVHLLEKDLNHMVSELRQSANRWNPIVEFFYLSILINLYSSYLRGTSVPPQSDPDHTLIQSFAAQAACQLVELFATSAPPVDGISTHAQVYPHRYLSKFHAQFNSIALLMLLKISALNQISLRQLGEVDDAIRLGHGALMACSSSYGDEVHRAAAVIEILCKKGVIETTSGDSPVESRFGASMWLQLIATAIRWRHKNAKNKWLPRKDRGADEDADSVVKAHQHRPSSASSVSRTEMSGDGPVTTASPVDSMDAARMVLEDIQETATLFPFSIDDWSAYLDADLGLGTNMEPALDNHGDTFT